MADNNGIEVNADQCVVCTGVEGGGWGKVLVQLLQPGCSSLIYLNEHVNRSTSWKGVLGPRCQVKACKHLIHYGVTGVLANKEGWEEEKERERENQEAQERKEEKIKGKKWK